ncbi:MAG TPA: hypothetical protein VG893_14620 [Terracidiphilus sp.]|nr:hypothetical protein [Terracidiphilus sp.]
MERKSKNLTIALAPSTYTRARVWAAERNISLSTIVAAFLEDLPHLRSFHGLSKTDLPRKARARRKAPLYIRIEAPAIPCVPVEAPALNPSAAPDTAGPTSC